MIDERITRNYNWGWKQIGFNPNLTIDFVNNHKYKLIDTICIDNNPDSIEYLIITYLSKIKATWYRDYIYNQISEDTYEYIYNRECHIILRSKMKPIFEELVEVCLHPNNMKLMKKLGVYSNISKEWLM